MVYAELNLFHSFMNIHTIPEIGGTNFQLISLEHIILKLLLLMFSILTIQLIIPCYAFPISSWPFPHV